MAKKQRSNKLFKRQSLPELLKHSVLGMSLVVGLALKGCES
jgi:hypothetical protein